MIIPAAMNIYSAEEALKSRHPEFITAEVAELRASRAATRLQGEDITRSGFEEGYILGLEVARVLLLSNVTLALAKIDGGKLI